jgi:MYXO-CTERM domain-containing protein
MDSKSGILAAVAALTLTLEGIAAPIHWVDWNSAVFSAAGAAGSVEGSLSINGSPIGVHYAGEVLRAQTGNVGTYYYGSPIPFLPSYVSAAVDNAPATSDIIEITGGTGTLNTFFFDAPLVDPVMAIVSLGSPSVSASYHFNTPFTVLSSGYGYWGMGPQGLTDVGGNTLRAMEAHGVIQFLGTYSSISFTAPEFEDWHGFTIGAADAVSTVPEPDSLILAVMGVSLLAFAGVRRRRRLTRVVRVGRLGFIGRAR